MNRETDQGYEIILGMLPTLIFSLSFVMYISNATTSLGPPPPKRSHWLVQEIFMHFVSSGNRQNLLYGTLYSERYDGPTFLGAYVEARVARKHSRGESNPDSCGSTLLQFTRGGP